MSAEAGHDLSGPWTGIYNYPADYPPNGFEALLSETGGAIAGTISEQDEAGQVLHSVIEGRRQGDSVTFIKIYDDLERMPDPIYYSGTLEPDGNEISGTWSIVGFWSGTFLMIRSSGAAEVAEQAAAETVEAGR